MMSNQMKTVIKKNEYKFSSQNVFMHVDMTKAIRKYTWLYNNHYVK